MFTVNTYGGQVRVYMGEVEYKFSTQTTADEFKAELCKGLQSVQTLVERFMNFLQRVTARVVSEIVRMARVLADSDYYWLGRGGATYREAQRYFSIA